MKLELSRSINTIRTRNPAGVGTTQPVAESVSLGETNGVFSLSYSYSHPDAVAEQLQETQWESIDFGGSVVIGDTLTPTVFPAGTYTYQWYAADDNQGTNDAALVGATSSSLTLVDPTHLNKYIRVEATDANGDVYSSYYTAQVGYAANLLQAFVPEGETTTIVLSFDKFMDITDSTGWSTEKNDVANAITAVELFENTIILTVTNAIAQHDLITVSYNSTTGNTVSWATQLDIGDITERIADNFIGSTFGNEIRINFTSYNDDPVLVGNWNNLNFSLRSDGDKSLANLVDETGANIGATFATLLAEQVSPDEGNHDNTASTTKFPAPAWGDQWFIYDDNGDNTEKSTWRITGLTPYQVYRIWTSIKGKGFGNNNARVYETTGYAIYNRKHISSNNAVATTLDDVSYMAMADVNGAITIVQRAGQQGKNADGSPFQHSNSAPGIILDPVAEFDPRTLDFGALYMPMGAEEGGKWINWVSGADGWTDSPTYADPTWDAVDRAYSFDGTQGIRLDYNTSGISGSPYEVWVRFKTPASSFTSGETVVALSSSHYVRFTIAGALRWNATDVTGALSLDTWYVARFYINGASGLVEVRNASNGIVTAETTLNQGTSGFSSPIRVGSTFADANPYNGKIAFIGLKPTAFDTAGKNNMFDWIYNKIK